MFQNELLKFFLDKRNNTTNNSLLLKSCSYLFARKIILALFRENRHVKRCNFHWTKIFSPYLSLIYNKSLQNSLRIDFSSSSKRIILARL